MCDKYSAFLYLNVFYQFRIFILKYMQMTSLYQEDNMYVDVYFNSGKMKTWISIFILD